MNIDFSSRWFDLEITLRAARDLRARNKGHESPVGGVDLFLCVVDHFEPQVGQPTESVARERLEDWLRRYPQVAGRHRDSEGRVPPHGYFYPYDEYDEWEFTHLVEHCAEGWGEIELHLHHRDDTSDSLRAKFEGAIRLFHSQGALTKWPDGRPAYAFIHGNWALDNSRQDHGRNYCGVNNEITLLKETGCYADFTFPAWQHTAQPRQVNAIYYATDDPLRPKSYDYGQPVQVGRAATGDLLLIAGPLVPYFRRSKFGPRLALDDSDLASYRRFSPERLDRWVRTGIHVEGRPDRIFIKLHCHGEADRNRNVLLGEDFEALFSDAEARYNDGKRYRLHYVTAREMFNIVKATEAGAEGEIEALRDWILPPPHTGRP